MKLRPTLLLLTLLAGAAAAQTPGSSAAPAIPAARRTLATFATGGLETRSAALLLSGQEGGAIVTEMAAWPVAWSEEVVTLAIVIDIDGGSFLRGLEGDEAIGEIYLYALDSQSGVADYMAQAFQLQADQIEFARRRQGVKFLGQLELPTDAAYSLRLLVLNRRLDAISLRTLPIEVGAAAETGDDWRGFLSTLAEEWILVEQPGAAGIAPIRGLPWGSSEGSLVPSASSVELRAGANRVHLLSPNAAAAERPTRALLTEVDGRQAQEILLKTIEDSGTGGAPALVAEIELPADVGPGAYDLELFDSAEREVGKLHLPVVDEESGAGVLADLIPTEDAEALDPQLAAGAKARRRRGSQIEADYLAALTLLAGGDRTGARAAMVQLEVGAIRADRKGTGNFLTDHEIRVAVTLARDRLDNLVPLIYFHKQLYLDYSEQGLLRQATHSRVLAVRLAQLYARESNSEEANRVVATLYIGLANHLRGLGSFVAAQKALEGALEYDSENRSALSTLASIYETYGEYDRAAPLLRQLLRLEPDLEEAQLRLAVNLRRLGNHRDAEELLRGCLQSRQDWISTLAYQELASSMASRGMLEEAVELLAEAIERPVTNHRLRIQLAALLDRLQRYDQSRAVLEAIRVGREAQPDSPRLRYSQPWLANRGDAHEALRQMAQQYYGALDQSLAKLQG